MIVGVGDGCDVGGGGVGVGGWWAIVIFQGVLTKLNLLMKFQHLKKIIFFAFFCCGGGSNLILETGMENQILILRTPAAIKFFHQILKNCHFGVKKNHYPCRWICMTHIKAPTLFLKGIIIFQGVLTKFNF